MIKISIKEQEIIIKGHSDYDVAGKDIVCASVSSIAITTINAILKFDCNALAYEESDGYLKIVIKNHSKEVDLLICNMIELLKELENQYKKNIRID